MLSLRINRALLAAVCAVAMIAGAGTAQAQSSQVIKPNTVGAALALPYLTSPVIENGDRITVIAVTNTHQQFPVRLHVTWVGGPEFSALDRNCDLTPEETTYFIFTTEWTEEGDTTDVHYECSDGEPDFPGGNDQHHTQIHAMDGIMFVALECQKLSSIAKELALYGKVCGKEAPNAYGIDVPHRTMVENILTGDSTIVDFAQGQAFSVPAVHIQGTLLDGNVFGDRLYKFDSTPNEYYTFPSLLTTSYIAPDKSVTADLLLFTLDGSAAGTTADRPVQAAVRGFAYDDDENPTSAQIRFDCFEPLPINGSPNGWGLNVERVFGGHIVGHLDLNVAPVARSDAHELDPVTGNANGIRYAFVHGWIVQTISQDPLDPLTGFFAGGDYGSQIDGSAAWARQLTQGTNPLFPDCGGAFCDTSSFAGVEAP